VTTPAALPSAVPSYAPDADHLHRKLGEAHAYIGQLTTELRRRAEETNEIHDQLLAARARIAELERTEAG
jgi:hypothetical protein